MEQKTFTAKDLDLIDSQELVESHGINLNKLMVLLDTGQLSAYERSPGQLEKLYPSMNQSRKRWEKLTGFKAPDPRKFPEECLDVIPDKRAEYRCLTRIDVGGLTRQAAGQLYFSRAEVELLTGEETKISTSAEAKMELKSHVRKMVNMGLITSRDDLKKDPTVKAIQTEMNWADTTIEKYTQGCGIPNEKTGPKLKE